MLYQSLWPNPPTQRMKWMIHIYPKYHHLKQPKDPIMNCSIIILFFPRHGGKNLLPLTFLALNTSTTYRFLFLHQVLQPFLEKKANLPDKAISGLSPLITHYYFKLSLFEATERPQNLLQYHNFVLSNWRW